MTTILALFILIPLSGFMLSLIVPKRSEKLIAALAFGSVGIQLLLALGFSFYWLFAGHPSLNINEFVIYSTNHYSFFIDFYFDKIAATYLLVGAFLTFLITVYSKYYLHRDIEFYRNHVPKFYRTL